jgi:hypothetical protein
VTGPLQLSGNPTSSHLVANQEELGKGYDEFACRQHEPLKRRSTSTRLHSVISQKTFSPYYKMLH